MESVCYLTNRRTGLQQIHCARFRPVQSDGANAGPSQSYTETLCRVTRLGCTAVVISAELSYCRSDLFVHLYFLLLFQCPCLNAMHTNCDGPIYCLQAVVSVMVTESFDDMLCIFSLLDQGINIYRKPPIYKQHGTVNDELILYGACL